MAVKLPLSAFADEISPDLSTQLSVLNRLGVTGFDLRSVDGVNVLDLSDQDVVRVREACLAAGITPQAVGSPVNKVALTSGNRSVEMKKLTRACQDAELLGVERIRIFTPEAPAGAWESVRDWVGEQVMIAESYGKILLHENDAKFWGAYPEQAKQLFAEFGGHSFRAAFDFANTVLLGFKPLDDWFPWIVPYLDTIHIKDAIHGAGVVPSGQGEGQIEQTLSSLASIGWTGTLTMEPHLSAAGAFGGFSGEQLFTVAVDALRKVASSAGYEV